MYIKGLNDINDHGYIEIEEPSEEEKKRIETRLEEAKKQKKSAYEDIIEKFLADNPCVSKNKLDLNALDIYNAYESDEEIISKLSALCQLMGWI